MFTVFMIMNRRTTKNFRLAVCAFCLTFLSSCSDDAADVSAEKPNVKHDTQASRTLDGLAPTESAGVHSHDASGQGTKHDTADDHSKELDDEELSDAQIEEDYANDVYDEASRTLSIDNEPSEGVIRWQQPQDLAYSNAKITISSDSGETIVRDFGSGESIELYGELPDGVYGWESVITPQVSESVRDEMRAVRSSGDFNAERELAARLRAEGSLPTEQEARDNVQSGSFIVLNGVVNPRAVEEQN
jgi:hypothetical protein